MIMKIVTLIIDDDIDNREILCTYLKENCPQITVAGEAANLKQAAVLISKIKPDLLLLDIELPDGNGFDLLAGLAEREFEVIFITAFDKFAIEAFKFSAIDYLLKPIAYPGLEEALQKVSDRIEEKYFKMHWVTLTHNLLYKNPYEKRLAVTTGNGYVFIDLKDIIRLEANSNYTHFHLKDKKKMIASQTLGYYEGLLPGEDFCRIHNSHIVNIHFIDRYTKEGIGGTVIMQDGMELSVSQRRKDFFVGQLIKKPE